MYLESNGRRWEQLATLCKLNTHQTAHFEIFSKFIKSVNYKMKTSKTNEILFVILKITELYVITIFAKQIKSTKNPEWHSSNIYKVTRYSSQVLKISINAPYRISPLRNLFEKAITGIDGFTFQLVAMFALCTYLCCMRCSSSVRKKENFTGGIMLYSATLISNRNFRFKVPTLSLFSGI